jgi:hypothetical protein
MNLTEENAPLKSVRVAWEENTCYLWWTNMDLPVLDFSLSKEEMLSAVQKAMMLQ